MLLALSPVSLMVSGFHGNTDPVMVMFVVLAAAAVLRSKPILCAVCLALACQIKVIPLLLTPIFFFYWLDRRRALVFSLSFGAVLLAGWAEPLWNFPDLFAHRVLFYGSFWGLWGVTYWLKLTGIPQFAPVTYFNLLPLQQVTAMLLKGLIVSATIWLGWRRRQAAPAELFRSIGWVWLLFFILSPGVCTQYLVWPMPFLLVLSPRLFAWATASSSAFAFFFYNTIAGGLPWYLGISLGAVNDKWLPWSFWPWSIFLFGAFILWQRSRNRPLALTLNPAKPAAIA
jgi:uncharacterized membrane protein